FNGHFLFINEITRGLTIVFTDVTVAPCKYFIVVKENHIFHLWTVIVFRVIYKFHGMLSRWKFHVTDAFQYIFFIFFRPLFISPKNPLYFTFRITEFHNDILASA